MQTSSEIDKLAQALAKAQGSMEDAEKVGFNPHFKSKYADLGSVRAALRGPLSANGLAYVQTVRSEEGFVEIETRLLHESGQWLGDSLRIPLVQTTAQAVGSAISYGRRYSLMALVGLAAEDDDGHTAQPKNGHTVQPRTAATKPRVDPADDIAGREDREAPWAQTHAQPRQPAPRQAGDRLMELLLQTDRVLRRRERTWSQALEWLFSQSKPPTRVPADFVEPEGDADLHDTVRPLVTVEQIGYLLEALTEKKSPTG